MFAEGAADPHRQRRRLQPAADHRPVDQRRLRVPARGAGGAGPGCRWAASCRALVAAANQDPRLSRVFSTFTASNPSIYLDIDRDKAQALGPRHERRLQRAAGDAGRLSTSTTSTCSAAPGRSTSRARPPTAPTSPTSGRSTSATSTARWCRCARSPSSASCSGRRSSPATTTTARSPSTARRRRAAPRATALAAMTEVSAKTLPPGYGFEWTGTAYPGVRRPPGQTGLDPRRSPCCSPSCSWSALYESWMIPVPVLLSVSVGVLGAYRRHPDRRA